jgi:hypothetical protein
MFEILELIRKLVRRGQVCFPWYFALLYWDSGNDTPKWHTEVEKVLDSSPTLTSLQPFSLVGKGKGFL